MRQVFSETVLDERVFIVEGTFESTGVEDGWADIITIAQVRQASSFSGLLIRL